MVDDTFGGGEATPRQFMEVLEAVAMADASTAWCLGQGLGCSLVAAFLDPKVAHEIFDDPKAVVAWGPTSGSAKAVAVDGGYRATAYCLERGGIGARIRGIVLLDALYGEHDRLARWIQGGTGFAVILGGPSTAQGHTTLQHRLAAAGWPLRSTLPRRLGPGLTIMMMTPTSHRLLPLIGPPHQPLTAALARLD